MTHQNYTIFGTVTDQFGAPISGVRVSVDTNDPQFNNLDPLIYSGVTLADGSYVIEFVNDMMDEMFTNISGQFVTLPIPVRFSIVKSMDILIGTLDRLLSADEVCYGEEQDFNIVLEQDDDDCCCPPETPQACDGYSVFGLVRSADHSPAANVTIEVRKRLFRSDVYLTEGQTDDFGRFDIPYLEEEECSSDGPGVAIFLKAIAEGDILIATSATVHAPVVRQEINFSADCDHFEVSEYDEIKFGILPYMDGLDPETMASDQLQAHDVDYLAEKSDLSASRVELFLTAMQIYAHWRELDPTGVDEVPGQAWFAFALDGDRRAITDFAVAVRDQLLAELERAVAVRAVDEFAKLGYESTAVRREAIVDTLLAALAVDPLDDLDDPVAYVLNLGAFTGPDAKSDKSGFLAAYRAETRSDHEFWAQYIEDHELDTDIDAPLLRMHIQLVAATGNHRPLVQHLLASEPLATPANLRRLAERDATAWNLALAGVQLPDPYPGEDDDEKRANYAAALVRSFEHAFPEVAITHGLALDSACTTPDDCLDSAKIVGVCPCALYDIVIAHPEFSLRDSVVADFFADAGSSGPSEAQLRALEVVQRLYGLIPDFDAAAKIRAFIDAGFTSAQQLAKLGQTAFVAQFSNALGSQHHAMVAYYRAKLVVTTVTSMVNAASDALNPGIGGTGRPNVVDPASSYATQVGPTLEKLFGTFDHCSCKHCNSVLSPAAYLLDLLDYIGDTGRNVVGCHCDAPSAEDRRPDICNTHLTCANTLTPMPHIDLVNELLEERVSWANGTIEASDRQTTWSAEQLAAHPEHLDERAYRALRNHQSRDGSAGRETYAAVRPWNLPFDLFLTEARAYTQQLGSPMAEIVDLLEPDPTTRRDRIVREHLGLSVANHALIVDDRLPSEEVLDAAQPPTMAWFGDPAISGASPSLMPFRAVRTFLSATGLELYDALELLDTHWTGQVEAEQSKITLEYGPDAPCDLSQANFVQSQGNDETWRTRLGRVHRMVRLKNALEITGDPALELNFDELDEAIQKLTKSGDPLQLDGPFLGRLVDFARMRASFSKLSVPELLTWWGDIEARPDKTTYVDSKRTPARTLYATLFQNDADQFDEATKDDLTIDVAPNGSLELRAAGEGVLLFDASQTEQPYVAIVAAAYGISVTSLTELIVASDLELADPSGQPILNLRNLSLLYMRVSLARALDLTPSQLLAWESRCGISLTERVADDAVFTSGTAPELMAEIERHRNRGFELESLDFIVDGVLAPRSTLVLGEAAGQRAVLDALATIADLRANAIRSLSDVAGPERDFDKFSIVLDALAPDDSPLAAVLDKAILRSIVAADDAHPDVANEAARASYTDLTIDAQFAEIFRSTSDGSAAPSLYSDYWNFDEIEDPDARARVVAREILGYQLNVAIENAVAEILAPALGLDIERARAYLGDFRGSSVLSSFAASPELSPADLLRVAELRAIEDDRDLLSAIAADAPASLAGLVTILRATLPGALVIDTLQLDAQIVTWLSSEPEVVLPPEGLDHATRLALPRPDAFHDGGGDLPGLARLAEFVRIGRLVFDEFSAWLHLLSNSFAAGKTDVVAPLADEDLDALIEATGWEAAPLRDLIGADGVRPLSYGDLREFAPLERIGKSMLLQVANSASFFDMQAWIAVNTGAGEGEVSAEQARAIKLHAKSKYDEQTWSKVAGPLRDRLRERQRDALRAYVRDYYDHHADDGYSLYDWLLIDVDMSACAPTSRIKAAVGALQQLVQRWQLGLESEPWDNPVVAQDSQVKEWLWRGRYRVWEAQRKVYLFPENWLDSGLRDDATPQFVDFRDRVLGGEITDATVEKALMQYLRDLDAIAKLEVNGIYHELERADEGNTVVTDILHVFARSRGKSGTNFYRRRTGGSAGGWTAWEKLPFEIDGKDVLPVVFNRRLMVLWPRFEHRARDIEASELPKEGEDPKDPVNYLRMTLAWSELRFGEWCEPRESEAFADLDIPSIEEPDDEDGIPTDPAKVAIVVATNGRELHVAPLTSDRNHASGNPRRQWGYFVFGGCDGSVEYVDDAERLPRLRPLNATAFRQAFVGHGRMFATFGPQCATRPTTPILRSKLANDGYETLFDRQLSCGARLNRHIAFQDARANLMLTLDPEPRPSVPYDILNIGAADTIAFLPNATQLEAAQIVGSTAPLPKRTGSKKYDIEVFHHPYVCLMIQQVERFGPEGLYRPDPQASSPEIRELVRQTNEFALFDDNDGDYAVYDGHVTPQRPIEKFDFTNGGPYSVYNWELFYHIPMFLAEQLASAGKYADALQWYHYIFDPTETDIGTGADRADYWRIRPFGNTSTPIQRLLELLTTGKVHQDVSKLPEFIALVRSLDFAESNPFNPFGVARLRITPFQLATVMKYLDTLIAWGDELFRQESIESVAEATQLYVIAQTLLGERPVELPARETVEVDYCDVHDEMTVLNNALVEVENRLTPGTRDLWMAFSTSLTPAYGLSYEVPGTVPCGHDPSTFPPTTIHVGEALERPASGLSSLALTRRAHPRAIDYTTIFVPDEEAARMLFCIPQNDKILGYWDEIDDRLFKIRNCLNLAGQPRTIRLFEPPIDPGALVAALASGAGLSDAIDSLNTPPPHYRFSTHLGLAKSFAKELESLGSELLSVLERKDAEQLARLRADHELRVLDRVEDILQTRIKEANESHEALIAAEKLATDRLIFYTLRSRKLPSESAQIKLVKGTAASHSIAAGLSQAAAGAALVPEFTIGASGFAGSPVVEVRFGGQNVANHLSAIASSISSNAAAMAATAQTTGIEAAHARREEEWDHQAQQAKLDGERIAAEIETAVVRIELAQREYDRFVQQRKNAREIQAFLDTKFTNEELYEWMGRQLSRTMYQTYKLAFDLAKRAELCFKAELPAKSDRNYISFGAWENQRKGLLSGQRIAAQLRELESDYYTSNVREFELTKRISVNELDLVALLSLRETGECHFSVPEVIYDLDHPGHYLRRIKSVELSLPCLGGIFDEINATLTMTRSCMRVEASTDESALREDLRGGSTTIATSRGNSDSGLFESRMDDPRYLPFENKGAVSGWHLRLPGKYRKFDYQTISDVVLTIRYTARDGGEGFRGDIEGADGNPGIIGPGLDNASDPIFEGTAWPPGSGNAAKLLLTGLSVATAFPYAWRAFLDSDASMNSRLVLENVGQQLVLDAEDDEVEVHVILKYRDSTPTANLVLIGLDADPPIVPPMNTPGVVGPLDSPAIGPALHGNGLADPSTPRTVQAHAHTTWQIVVNDHARSQVLEDIFILARYLPKTHA